MLLYTKLNRWPLRVQTLPLSTLPFVSSKSMKCWRWSYKGPYKTYLCLLKKKAIFIVFLSENSQAWIEDGYAFIYFLYVSGHIFVKFEAKCYNNCKQIKTIKCKISKELDYLFFLITDSSYALICTTNNI